MKDFKTAQCINANPLQQTTSACPLRTAATRHQHGDVVAVQENLVQLGHPPALAGALVLDDVLQHHVDKVVEAEECAHQFLHGQRADQATDEKLFFSFKKIYLKNGL